MNEPEVRVRLESEAYRPGDVLRGAFCVEGEAAAELKTVELSVLWRSEGKGDEDLGVIHYAEWTPASGEAIDLSQPREFEVRLPRTPLSYDGVIVKVHWCARVRVRWADVTEVVEEAPFRLGNVAPVEAVR
jgi:hypothetical protein